MLSDQQFERTRRLALSLAGIELVERHRDLLARRQRRLGILNGAGLDSLLSAAESGEANATQQLLSLLTTKFTGFFRHPSQFDVAARHAVWAVQCRGRARLWSAGAATGEEPYSLAMALVELSGTGDPPATILATDIDEEALAVARRGQYRKPALRGLDPERRKRFLNDCSVGGCWAIAPAVARLVEFRFLNLVEVVWGIEGPFDVIFCRNVLMYLEAGYRYAALEQMASLLAPDGLLIQDPAEHLGAAAHLFTPRGSAVYAARKLASGDRAAPRAPLVGYR